MTYIYKLSDTYTTRYDAHDTSCEFASVANYNLRVKSGYAWNGCSPTLSLAGLALIGAPEGHVDYRTGKPLTYYASLVHDALYQYNIGTRKKADLKFYGMLKAANFPLARAYYIVVRLFGARAWKKNSKLKK